MVLPRRSLLLAAALAAAGSPGVADQTSGRYELQEALTGEDFLSKFTFFTGPDPTRGVVRYVDEATAVSEGLARATAGGPIHLGVDAVTLLPEGQGRKSVRIQSRNAYNAGLFIAKVRHVPTGCGVWPAFWMYGADQAHSWPTWGEFDIFEAVHENENVRTSLHTSPACNQRSLVAGEDFVGNWEAGKTVSKADVCDIDAPGQFENQGCSQKGPFGSAGAAFNAHGGGTFAAEWDPVRGHIRTWFWPSGAEPADVTGATVEGPSPDRWGRPYSHFSLSPVACPAEHFMNMRLVFNTDLCGDMGDATFQYTRCAKDVINMSGANLTCNEFVARHPEMLDEAYWSIDSLDVFQQSGPLPANLGARTMFDFGMQSGTGGPLAVLASRWVPAVFIICALVAVALVVVLYVGMVEWNKYQPVGGAQYLQTHFGHDYGYGYPSHLQQQQLQQQHQYQQQQQQQAAWYRHQPGVRPLTVALQP